MDRLSPFEIQPTLMFRYYIEFLNYPDVNFGYTAGYSVDNPKWTIENGWSNPISIKFYRFELVQALETILIKVLQSPKNNAIRINLLNPTGNPIAYWDIVGDIEVCDFGHMTWKDDDVLSIEMKILPLDCKFTNLIQDNGQETNA